MPLTADQEALEFELRVEQMRADIDLKQAQALKSKQDWRLDPQRVLIQWAVAVAAVFGAAGTAFGYLLGRGH